MGKTSKDRVIVARIIRQGRGLGISFCAESVEEKE